MGAARRARSGPGLSPLLLTSLLALLLALLLTAALGAAGCDPGGGGGEDAGPPDAGPPDAGAPLTCPFPEPMVAGTPETDALADAPARCGQPAHAWLRDPALGTVTELGTLGRYPAAVLGSLAAAAGATLPREPEEPVAFREYRYLTQDRGVLVESTATVAYPEGRAPGDRLDVLLLLHGTSGFTAGCGPSSDESGILAALLASYGYLVVAPDYLGLEWGESSYGALHPYLVGQATAIASLDALRAAGRMDPSERGELCARPRVLTVGGSQGGHAALWVDRLMPYYARELEPLGVVATVPPADLVRQSERGLSSLVDASANIAAMFTAASPWYGLEDRLGEVLRSPYEASLPESLASECRPRGFDGITAVEELYTTALIDAGRSATLASVEPWGCLFVENGLTSTSVPRLGGDSPSYGIFFITGEADPLVHTPIERESYRTLCEAGVPLRYLECEGANHGEGTLWSLGEALGFADARVAGEAFVPGPCEPPPPTRCAGTP